MTARLSALQSTHAASHSRLQVGTACRARPKQRNSRSACSTATKCSDGNNPLAARSFTALLQAMHAELEASQAQLRQGLAFITVGVDQLGEEMSLLNHAGSGSTVGGSSPRRSPRSPYTKKLGRLLARELLAQRAQQAQQAQG